MTIYVQHATSKNIISSLKKLLEHSGFYNIQEIIGKNDPVVIKVNLATMSQSTYQYGTTPSIPNTVVDILYSMGFTNVSIVEAQSNFTLFDPCLTVGTQGKMFGYRYPVIDLTTTNVKPFIFGFGSTVLLSEVMLGAKFIINIPKAKNHD